MPNIFENITTALGEVDLDASVSVQVNGMSIIDSELIDLIQNPPTELSDLKDALAVIPLPPTNSFGNLPAVIESLQQLVPSTLDTVTGGLDNGIQGLGDAIENDMLGLIKPYIDAYNGIKELLERVPGAGNETGAGGSAPTGEEGTGEGEGGGGSETGSGEVSTGEITAPSPTGTGLAKVVEAMNLLPDPFNAENLLQFMLSALNALPRNEIPAGYIPVVDELRNLLETLFEWLTLNGTQIGDRINDTLAATANYVDQCIENALGPLQNQLDTFLAELDVIALKTLIENILTEFQNLKTAVEAGDLAGIDTAVTNLNSLLSQLNTMLGNIASVFFEGQNEYLLKKYGLLSIELETQIVQLYATLTPPPDANLLKYLGQLANDAYRSKEIDSMMKGINQLFGRVSEVLSALDLSPVAEPIATAAETARGIVDELDNVLIEAVTQVKLLFDEADALIDQVDTEAIADDITTAIESYQEALQDEIDALFDPAKDAITTAVNAIGGAADDFDPKEIIDSLRETIHKLTQVIADPEILGKLNAFKDRLDEIVDEFSQLSFKPVNDVVIEEIGKVKTSLETIDPEELNNLLKIALLAALELLPLEEALDQIKKELLQRMEQLITDGPVKLLDQIKTLPDKLKTEVRKFSPENLIGDQFSQPFLLLVAEVEKFKPSELFAPIQQFLDSLRSDLQTKASPTQFLAPVITLYDQLVASIDQLNPAGLIGPLQAKIDEIIDAILNAIPIEDFLDAVNKILNQITQIGDVPLVFGDMLNRVSEILHGLDNPEAQIDAWIASIVAKIDTVPDTVTLTANIAQIIAAIDKMRAAAIETRLVPPLQGFIDSLNTLQPQALLTDMIREVRDFPTDLVAGLPNPQRTAIEALFAGFDPLANEVSAPLAGLQDLLEKLEDIPTNIQEFLADWDVKFHGPHSPLADCFALTVDVSAVKAMLTDALEEDMKQPLLALLGLAEKFAQVVDGFIAVYDPFITEVLAKIFNIFNGPDSIQSISDSLQELIDKIRGFNLDFLVDELNDLFANVKSKFEAISPALLAESLEVAFNEVLSNLSLDTLLPTEQIESLDASFQLIIDKVKALDPKIIVTDVLQPEFDQMVEPYLEVFDLTEIIQKMIDKLKGLDEELDEELERTCDAFLEMLDSVPKIELSLDIDIGIDIGF